MRHFGIVQNADASITPLLLVKVLCSYKAVSFFATANQRRVQEPG